MVGFLSDIEYLNVSIVYLLMLGAYDKLSARAKGTTVRQVLSGTVFLNFHHLHPEFQKFILFRMKAVYKSKKEVQADVTFFLIVSVSVSYFRMFPFGWLINLSLTLLLYTAISLFYYVVFWGFGHSLLDRTF